MKLRKTDFIVIAVLLMAFAFVVGYTMGMSYAINKCISVGKQFVDINETLIRDYLSRAGL